MPETTYLEAIREALLEEMERDPAVVLLGEDIGVYGGAFQATAGLLERFGWERVIDTPISETAIVGAAVGMSYLGLRPVVEMQFIDFIVCAFNQITNVAAKSHYRAGAPVPLVIRGPSGGGVHGGPFHSTNPEMYFVHTPGLKVVCPATAYDAKGLLKSAIRATVYRITWHESAGDDRLEGFFGCFRLINPDVIDLYDRVPVGAPGHRASSPLCRGLIPVT